MYMQKASLIQRGREGTMYLSHGHCRVDTSRNVTYTCPYALTGGIPYDRWSEGMVVAEVTRGYQMPKPDHVDNKL